MEFLLIWFGLGFASAIVMRNKERGGCSGWLLGLILGPIGLLIALVSSKNDRALERRGVETGKLRKCPFCAEYVRYEAVTCKYCGQPLPRRA